MSSSEVVVNEQALVEMSDCLRSYISQYREMLKDALRKIKLNSSDWNDEDFNSLLSAINLFNTDVDAIEEDTNRLIERINEKIVAIHELHNMRI